MYTWKTNEDVVENEGLTEGEEWDLERFLSGSNMEQRRFDW